MASMSTHSYLSKQIHGILKSLASISISNFSQKREILDIEDLCKEIVFKQFKCKVAAKESSSMSSGKEKDQIDQDLSKTFTDINQMEPNFPLSEFPLETSEKIDVLDYIIQTTISKHRVDEKVGEFMAMNVNHMAMNELIVGGLLVVTRLLQHLQVHSEGEDKCFELLEQMASLATLMKQMRSSPEMANTSSGLTTMKESLNLIMNGFLCCCLELSSSKFRRFRSNEYKIRKKMKKICSKMQPQIMKSLNGRMSKTDIKYPKNSVGIEGEAIKVIAKLQCRSNLNAVAVVVRGYYGSGKTTLASKAFYGIDVENCQYCAVTWLKDSNIMELQKLIIKGLQGDSNEVCVKTNKGGRNQIAKILRKKPSLIFIDNVLGRHELEELLPMDLSDAKKLRLLITARDSDVCMGLNLSTPIVIHDMKPLCYGSMVSIANNILSGSGSGTRTRYGSRGIGDLVKRCMGVPGWLCAALEDLSKSQNMDPNPNSIELQKRLMRRLKGETLDLSEDAKDALLDITFCFNGWQWDCAANILGHDMLYQLTSKSLVRKSTEGLVSVDNAILGICKEELVSATRFKGFLYEFQMSLSQSLENTKALWFEDESKIYELVQQSNEQCGTPNEETPILQSNCKISPIRVLRLNSTVSKQFFSEMDSLFWYDLIFLDCYAPFKLDAPKLKFLHVRKSETESLSEVNFQAHEELREVNVSESSKLESLPKYLKVLSHLRILRIIHCPHLKDLGDCLKELHLLYEIQLFHCPEIESREMDNILQIPSLLFADIRNSTLLEAKWRTIDKRNVPPKLAVNSNVSYEELLDGVSACFISSTNLFNVKSEEQGFGEFAVGTALLFVVDCSPMVSNGKSLADILEDLDKGVKILYIGRHYQNLPREVKEKIYGTALPNQDAHLLIQTLYNSIHRKSAFFNDEQHFVYMMSYTLQENENESRKYFQPGEDVMKKPVSVSVPKLMISEPNNAFQLIIQLLLTSIICTITTQQQFVQGVASRIPKWSLALLMWLDIACLVLAIITSLNSPIPTSMINSMVMVIWLFLVFILGISYNASL